MDSYSNKLGPTRAHKQKEYFLIHFNGGVKHFHNRRGVGEWLCTFQERTSPSHREEIRKAQFKEFLTLRSISNSYPSNLFIVCYCVSEFVSSSLNALLWYEFHVSLQFDLSFVMLVILELKWIFNAKRSWRGIQCFRN